MKKISIQFHATLTELVEYINAMLSEFGLAVTIMTPKPFALKKGGGQLSVDDFSSENDTRIIFTKEKPIIDASSPNNFYDLNPGTIGLHVGRLTDQGLKESAFSFMSDDQNKIDLANKLASRLKKITKAGAIAINPISGAEAVVRSHRYTEGAKSMYDGGVRMLPLAGNSLIKLTG